MKLNASLITAKYQKFQDMVSTHYENLKATVSKYTEVLGQDWKDEAGKSCLLAWLN